LEYDNVFITGLEDGLLPHMRSFDEPDGMAEERRLLYVGITRTRNKLYITRAFRRRGGQYFDSMEPSRFLFDLPPHLLEGAGSGTTARQQQQSYYQSTTWDAVSPRASYEQQFADPDEKIIQFPDLTSSVQFKTGVRVRHQIFGEGVVIESKPHGNDEEVTVAFEKVGIKRLMASFAKLKTLKG